MSRTSFISIAAVLFVYAVAWFIRAAMTAPVMPVEKPVEHIEPGDLMDPEPKFTRPQDRALARRLKDSIRTKLQGRG